MSELKVIDDDVKKYISQSVLCWLATCDENGQPNVSPKEMFTWKDESELIVAHLASPNTVKNIRVNNRVCVSFVDVFVQKGYKIKGTAKIIEKRDPEFPGLLLLLTNLYSDKYPVKAIIKIQVTDISGIVAPSYFLFPETTEEGQVKAALKTYKVQPSVD